MKIKMMDKLVKSFAVLALVALTSTAWAEDVDNNPPGPAGGTGTNWENKPGPTGGPGTSPDYKYGYRWKHWCKNHTEACKKSDLNNDGTIDNHERNLARKHFKHLNPPPPGAGQKWDKDNNPPGMAGGPGTNWENKPGPAGGPGTSPDYNKKWDKDNNPPGPAGGTGTNWENKPGPAGGPGASPNRKNPPGPRGGPGAGRHRR